MVLGPIERCWHWFGLHEIALNEVTTSCLHDEMLLISPLQSITALLAAFDGRLNAMTASRRLEMRLWVVDSISAVSLDQFQIINWMKLTLFNQ